MAGDYMFGNLFMVGLTSTDLKIVQELIKRHIGGIILYSRLYKNYQEMLDLINYIKRLAEEENYKILK